MSVFVQACRRGAKDAAKLGYPVFGRGLGEETPLNSSPYLLDLAAFRAQLGWSPQRALILDRLEERLRMAADVGVRVELVLAAGSFLTKKRDPRDLDCLVFYSLEGAGTPEAVVCWHRSLAGEPLDLKLCPLDVGPLVLLKRGIFFANLFSYDREEDALVRGSLLVTTEGLQGRIAA